MDNDLLNIVRETLLDQPLRMAALMTVFQATVIAVVALGLSRLCRSDATWMYRVWMAAVLLMLAIVPLQIGALGWDVSLSRLLASGNRVTTTNERAFGETAGDELMNVAQSSASAESNHFEGDVQQLAKTVERTGGIPAITSQDLEGQLLKIGNEASLPVTVVNANEPAATIALLNKIFGLLRIVYLVGGLLALLRLMIGSRYLVQLKRSGKQLQEELDSLLRETAEPLQLNALPTVRLVPELEMPLVYGVRRGVLLLPGDFEDWPSEQQRAVLVHELSHLKRCDLWGELCSQFMRIVYWFHPAAWLVARRVRLVREMATDQAVIRAGWDRGRYAKGLLDVVHRSSSAANAAFVAAPSVAMAGFGDLEQRLTAILRPPAQPLSKLRGAAFVVVLILLTIFTTCQIRDEAVAAVPLLNDTETILLTDNDLVERIKVSRVATYEGDDYAVELTVRGQVLSASGEPVANAVVVLRESSNRRISSELSEYHLRPWGQLSRIDDVFAKAVTDENGKFVIESARAPKQPSNAWGAWEGDIVAAHPEFGIGWMELEFDGEAVRSLDALTLTLQATASIEGRYESPAGQSLAGRVIELSWLEKGKLNFRAVNARLALSYSQLTLQAVTDAEGCFRFSNLPRGFIASVHAIDDDQWIGPSSAVATSDDVPLGIAKDRNLQPISWFEGRDIIASPIVLTADPGIHFRGTVVDEAQRPVRDVQVSFGGYTKRATTDARGEFDLHLATSAIEKREGRPEWHRSLKLYSSKAEYLPTRYTLTEEQIANREDFELVLQRGCRVIGKVVTATGEPCSDVTVNTDLPEYGQLTSKTNVSGEYQFFLPPGEYELVFTTEVGRYRLPPRYPANSEFAKANPVPAVKRSLSVEAGKEHEVETVIVQRYAARIVQVFLPSGDVAEKATLQIIDLKQRVHFRQQALVTDGDGLATVIPHRDGEGLMIDAEYVVRGKSYSGTVKFIETDADSDQPVKIILVEDYIVAGRVLIDGQPVAGAVIQVDARQPEMEGRATGDIRWRTSSRQRRATTGNDGRWLVWMRPASMYSASLLNAADIDRMPAIVPIAKKVEDGLFIVKDYEFSRGDGVIAGQLLNAEGTPIVGAWVSMADEMQAEFWDRHHTESERRTDINGRFVLRGLPRGKHQLEVTIGKSGDPVPQSFTAQTGEKDVRLVVQPYEP